MDITVLKKLNLLEDKNKHEITDIKIDLMWDVLLYVLLLLVGE